MHTQLPSLPLSTPLFTLLTLCSLCCACNTPDPVDDTTQDTSLPTFSFDNALAVSDQRPEPANAVLVDAVTLDDETPSALLVIRESDASGLPSRTIGTLRVNASGSNLTVPLERDLLAGERLHAALYEAGEADTFDFMSALPLLGEDGLPVQHPFTISLPDFASLTLPAEQTSSSKVYIASIQVEQVEATTQNSLLVPFVSADDATSERRDQLAITTLPIQGPGAQDLVLSLSPLDPDTTQRFPNNTLFHVALFQDNAPLGSLGPEDMIELDAAGEPVIVSTTVRLDPQPDASLSCPRQYVDCLAEGPLTLDLDIRADDDGYILAQYNDMDGAPQSSLTSIQAGTSSIDELSLPTAAACGSEITISLLVDLPELSTDRLITLDPLPLARNAEDAAQQCTITARDPLQLVSNLSLVDDDTISAEIFANYLANNPSEALFLAIFTTGDTPTLIGTRRLTEPLSQIEIDLIEPVASGDTLLFKLYMDGGEPFIFEPEGGVDMELFWDEDETQPAEQTITLP